MKYINAVGAIIIWQNKDPISILLKKNQGSAKYFPGYHEFPWQILNLNQSPSSSIEGLYHLCKNQLYFDLEKLEQIGAKKEIQTLDPVQKLEFNSSYFNLTYYLIKLSKKPEFKKNSDKFESIEWGSPQHYLQQYNRGKLLLSPPTINLLNFLIPSGHKKEEEFFDKEKDSSVDLAFTQPLKAIYQIQPISHPPLPHFTHRTNCFILGNPNQSLVIIDPSPYNEPEYQQLIKSLHMIGKGYKEIFLTHHHRDHHQRAPLLAKQLSIPISMSRVTYQYILKNCGKNYFNDIKIKWLKEGDILTYWLDEPVKIYEIPGHDEGQLGLAPESITWFLVGDLIQSQGSVVIGQEEGDMAKYYQSLNRIIQMKPQFLLPSHGSPVGTTYQLENTLQHRLIRENQIFKLYEQGKKPEQIVKIIYKGVDRALWPLALENVHSHLHKLKRENKI